MIGLLTILGFSLYDTVIVFDKVEENTHGFEHTTRRTFAEQANLAINQTFMRSINTSLISVLPILALMVVAVWLLGVGTLKDLALVQLVGVIVGTYSSIFFATPLLVTLRERTDTGAHPHPPGAQPPQAGGSGRPAPPSVDRRATRCRRRPARSRRPAATPAPDKPAPGARPIRSAPAGRRASANASAVDSEPWLPGAGAPPLSRWWPSLACSSALTVVHGQRRRRRSTTPSTAR